MVLSKREGRIKDKTCRCWVCSGLSLPCLGLPQPFIPNFLFNYCFVGCCVGGHHSFWLLPVDIKVSLPGTQRISSVSQGQEDQAMSLWDCLGLGEALKYFVRLIHLRLATLGLSSIQRLRGISGTGELLEPSVIDLKSAGTDRLGTVGV